MKLLVLHDKPRGEMGGMNAFIAAQNALFEAAGHEVREVICTPQAQAGALHLEPSGRRPGGRSAHALCALLAQERPDAAIVHSPYYALGPGALTALQGRLASIYVLHDVTPWCPRSTRLTRGGAVCSAVQGLGCVRSGCYRLGETGRPLSDAHGLLMRGLQMRAAHAVRQWVVPSRYLADLLALHGVDRRRIATVPHFAPEAPCAVAEPVPARLLYAGRLVAEKGLGCLFDALPALQCPGWSLHIAGEGPERDCLARLAAQRGWGARIRWLGPLSGDALAAEYAQASVVVMPSLIPESFGLVGLEAMAQARPVVGFASGGMSEWLRDGVTGRVAAWGDAGALARAIDDLLQDPAQARRLGAQGREIARREFGAALHLRRMQDLIAAAVDGRRTAPAHSSPTTGEPVAHGVSAKP
jgi:glycosyltransferase involved in cell wall biosynthesis